MTPSTPFFYLLVEDNRTAVLAGSEPPWGRQLQGLPADGGFQMTDWHDIAHVLVRRLAGHPSRTLRPTKATVCVVASPLAGDRDHAKAAMKGSGCSHPSRVRERLLALGEDVCPGRLVYIGPGQWRDSQSRQAGRHTTATPRPRGVASSSRPAPCNVIRLAFTLLAIPLYEA